MSAFKVGDEVLVRARVREAGDGVVHCYFRSAGCWSVMVDTVQPATRAPWDVLREAAAVVDHHHGAVFLQTALRDYADSLEAAARPPSLLEAAKAMLAEVNAIPLVDLRPGADRACVALEKAIAAAEKEAGQ